MPRVAFSTLSCPDWTWTEVLQNGTRYGYDGVEIRLLHRETDLLQLPEFRPGELATRRRELADAGLKVCGLASSVRFDYPTQKERDEQVAIGRAYVDLARELEAGFVRVFGDVVPKNGDPAQRECALRHIANGLDQLAEYAATLERSIFIETHGDFTNSVVMREMLEFVQHPAVGVLWDTHHPWRFFGEEPLETFERLGPWIRHTHWKDSVTRTQRPVDDAVREAAEAAHKLMSGHRHADYVLFGEGEFPASACMQLLTQAGYDGWYSLEWEKMWHPEIEGPEVVLPPFPEMLRKVWQSVQSET